MSFLEVIGAGFLKKWRFNRDIAAVVWGVINIAVRPRFWPRTVRSLMAKQILFSGVDALGLVLLIAVLAGVSVVAQTQYWLSNLGQSAMLGSILVAVIIREVGPLLVNVLVIARSGKGSRDEFPRFDDGRIGVLVEHLPRDDVRAEKQRCCGGHQSECGPFHANSFHPSAPDRLGA